VLESAVLPRDRFPEPFVYPLGGLDSRLHPVAYVENPPGALEAAYNWFLPSPSFLEAGLRQTGFAQVTVVSVSDERVVLVARKPDAAAPLAARPQLLEGATAAPRGGEVVLRVRAENRGALGWPAAGALAGGGGPVRLGAHLFAAGEEADWDYGRGALPTDVAPGEAVEVSVHLRAPREPGSYVVELDMVAEQRAWFEDLGGRCLRHPLEVG
jgi:hypothetical protein